MQRLEERGRLQLEVLPRLAVVLTSWASSWMRAERSASISAQRGVSSPIWKIRSSTWSCSWPADCGSAAGAPFQLGFLHAQVEDGVAEPFLALSKSKRMRSKFCSARAMVPVSEAMLLLDDEESR